MKKTIIATSLWLTLASVLWAQFATDKIDIDTMLELSNLTTTQRDAETPAAGCMIYNTTTSAVQYYDTAWQDVAKGAHTDTDAIHDNVAGEINAITEKTTPVNGDWLLIEDSAATNAKKKIQIGNLPSGGGGVTNLNWSIHPHNAPYKNTTQTAYEVHAMGIFAGTTELGTPTNIKVNAWKATGGTSFAVRIYDLTNALAVAELTGQTGESSGAVLDMGTLSNLSTGASVWEFQQKVTGTTTGYMSSVTVEF